MGLDLGKTSYKDLVFAPGEILSLVGAQNGSLSIILIYYIKMHISHLKNFARFTSGQKKTNPKARFWQTRYKDLFFARGEFLSVVGAQNKSLRIILIFIRSNTDL